MSGTSRFIFFYLFCFVVITPILFTTVKAGQYNLDGYVTYTKANSDNKCFARIKYNTNEYQGVILSDCKDGRAMMDLLAKAFFAHQKVRVTIEGNGEDYKPLYAVEYLEE